MIGWRITPPVSGPRNSVVKYLRGEQVSEDEMLRDDSEWIFASHTERLSEVWVDLIHDYVHEE